MVLRHHGTLIPWRRQDLLSVGAQKLLLGVDIESLSVKQSTLKTKL